MHELRPYQAEAVTAVYRALRERDDNPCVVLPTGTGKSHVIARIAADAVSKWGGRVLILAHVKELLQQNAEKVQALCPTLDIGIHSAGLGSRDTEHAVIVAGIQSVYRRACDLGRFDLVIVDEAHLIPPDGDGMYRSYLADALTINPALRVIGMTATPYRMRGGLICRPDNLLNHVCYEAGLRQMIADGYLCGLKSRGGLARADLSSVHVRGGEFVAKELGEAMDRQALVRQACAEIVELTADRRSILIFTAGVSHCRHVAAEISRLTDQEVGIVTGATDRAERADLIARFRGESLRDDLFQETPPLRWLANVNVLTTGFDAPNLDCIVLLRPTMSAGLYVQMVGRGTRLHPGKEDCLILDYGGNVLRHGPVDCVTVEDRTPGTGAAPAKECPECHALVHCGYSTCPECGFEFPPPEESAPHESSATGGAILSSEVIEDTYPVHAVEYDVHIKRGADPDHPRTMRVTYRYGMFDRASQWVCPEHDGYARRKFECWWRERSVVPPPRSAETAVSLAEDGALAQPLAITLRWTGGSKWPDVTGAELGPKPDYTLEPGWDDDVGAEPEDDLLPAMHPLQAEWEAGADEELIPF